MLTGLPRGQSLGHCLVLSLHPCQCKISCLDEAGLQSLIHTPLNTQGPAASRYAAPLNLPDLPQPPSTYAVQAFLGGDDDLEARSCSSCKEVAAASRKLQLYMLPDVLVVNLKRFQQTQQGTSKLNTMVEFPVQGWDLSDYVQSPQVFESVFDSC